MSQFTPSFLWGISSPCVGASYEVAVRTSAPNAVWTKVGTGTVTTTSRPVTLGSSVEAETIADVALTMHKPSK